MTEDQYERQERVHLAGLYDLEKEAISSSGRKMSVSEIRDHGRGSDQGGMYGDKGISEVDEFIEAKDVKNRAIKAAVENAHFDVVEFLIKERITKDDDELIEKILQGVVTYNEEDEAMDEKSKEMEANRMKELIEESNKDRLVKAACKKRKRKQ